ncbi:MAG TPA: DUF3618 domain-containing protein [Allosphingosinicella sp.]|jgi:hypothetical protein
MSKSGNNQEARQLEQAAADVERAKKRLASTMGALQYRLKPATLMNNAWEGVRDRGGEVADTTLQAVKGRPVTVSGILAALLIFLARDPLRRLVSSLFSRRGADEEGTIQANLEHDENFDLTAPTVERSRHEGVNA